jgi:hypothetical protein
VAVNLTKRRRGKANSRQTVHWEVGADSRQLHTSGGFYLLLHALTARGRALSGSTSVWSIWATELNGDPAKRETNGHIDPFARRLGRAMHLDRWARRHGLLDDDGKPSLPDCQPTRCRNVALSVSNREALAGHRTELHTSLQAAGHLAPYLRHRLQQRYEEIDGFLTTHAHTEDRTDR